MEKFDAEDYFNLMVAFFGQSKFDDLDSQDIISLFYHMAESSIKTIKELLNSLVQQNRLNSSEVEIVNQFNKNIDYITKIIQPMPFDDWDSILESYGSDD